MKGKNCWDESRGCNILSMNFEKSLSHEKNSHSPKRDRKSTLNVSPILFPNILMPIYPSKTEVCQEKTKTTAGMSE